MNKLNHTKEYLIIIFCFYLSFLYGYEFTPIVKQFAKKDYAASNQNWAVAQTADGIMCFGNNEGLLSFDGSVWETHLLPHRKIARSLFVDNTDRIYVGSFEEFGFFERNEYGELLYKSISDKLSNYEMKNDEIWNILNFQGTIIFQSFTSYFTYDGKRVEGFRCPYTFLFFGIHNHNIYTHTNQSGLGILQFKSNKVTPLKNDVFKSPVISFLHFDKKQTLLVTTGDGLFLYDGRTIVPFRTNADEELKRSVINRAVISKNGLILLGTILNGVIAVNKDGIKQWTLNSSNVLQNNTVLGMYCDMDDNLWLSLDKGISMIQLTSTLQYIRSFNPSVGSIYTLHYKTPNLYLGTNQGLYVSEFNGNNIEKVSLHSAIKGQVWNLSTFDQQIFCGNNDETREITTTDASIASPVKGGICMAKGIIRGQEVLVQGTYSELCIYLKKDGKWKFSHTVENFLNPIRYIAIDYAGTIWATHLHQGLYAIQLNNDLRKIEHLETYTTLDGKNSFNTNVFTINGRVVFTDHTKFYTYDDIGKKIIVYHELNEQLNSFAQAYRICHFKSNLYWFIRSGEAALVEISANKIKLLDEVQYAQFQNQTVDDYQNIIPISDSSCIFTLENGLALYNIKNKTHKAATVKLRMKSVLCRDNESKTRTFLSLNQSTIPSISFSQNNISFTVFYSDYSQLNNLNNRFKLEGLDKVWSEPTVDARKTYNYLPYGKYNLQVEVLTNSGFTLGQLHYRFEVLPPFYLTNYAIAIYFLLTALLIYLIVLYIMHLFKIKKGKIRREQEEIRRKEIEKREQQIMVLQNEKLETELTLKSKELAESTMTIIKKNEVLVSFKDEITAQKNVLGSQYPNKYYDKLVRMLDQNLSSEDDWAIFQTNFDRIHENFFRNLHIKYPELTSNDLRFCAYLRLNLSSKDIAHLMNISLKGVEVARSRIRKKIGIPSSKSLTEFMIEFK
ncbi:MAG: hypothetical protein Q7U47_06685 [Paludibacter sp.]|nr:hypothetical protein [Paludibacter sp.]